MFELKKLSPEAIPLALEKAEAASRSGKDPHSWILGADTIVVDGDDVLGKPGDAEEARAMLRRLAGRSHEVITAIALIEPGSGSAIVDSCCSIVT